MMKTLDEVSALVEEGRLLQIAGNADLLRQLPKGNWVGGSTEYFMTAEGGIVTDKLLFVTEFAKGKFTICDYGMDNIDQIAVEAYDNGFSILIMPFNSAVCMEYARKVPDYEDMFLKNIVGWVSGGNIKHLRQQGYSPIVVNGMTGEIHTDMAVVLHLEVPESQTVSVNILNIFSRDENAPYIEFDQEGYTVTTCRVDSKKMSFADYIAQSNLDTKLPIISDYYGYGLNVDIQRIENGVVQLGAPVFPGTKYRQAKAIHDYEAAFNEAFRKLKEVQAVFACNCLSNFMHGGLEGKKLNALFGPVVFGEIAYQLLSQTLVYVILE